MRSKDVEYMAIHHPEYISVVERNYWVNFVLLALDMAFYNFSFTMFSQDTILPFFVSHLTESALLIGLVPAIFFLGNFFPQLFGAYLANRVAGRKWQIFSIAVTQRLGLLMIALTVQYLNMLPRLSVLVFFFLSYAFYTSANGIIGPAYSDFTSKAIIRQRGLFYGVSYGLGGLVGFGASALASRLLSQLAYPHNLQVLFWLGFSTSFISPFLIANFREVKFPEKAPVESLKEFFGSIPRRVQAYPIFVRYLVTRALIGLGLMGNAFYAVYAIQHFSMGAGSLGIFSMVLLFSQSMIGLLWGYLGDRFGYKKVLLAAAGLIGLEAVIALLATASWQFFGIAILMGGVYAAGNLADPNLVFEIVPPRETSRYIGIANTLLGPVYALAPLLGGLLVDSFSHQALFMAVLGLALVGLLATWKWMVEPRRRGGEGQ
ncbi:MAG: MFS transporter [Pseudomonadota bacterium]